MTENSEKSKGYSLYLPIGIIDKIEQDAKEMGVSVSEYVKWVLAVETNEQKVKAKLDYRKRRLEEISRKNEEIKKELAELDIDMPFSSFSEE